MQGGYESRMRPWPTRRRGDDNKREEVPATGRSSKRRNVDVDVDGGDRKNGRIWQGCEPAVCSN